MPERSLLPPPPRPSSSLPNNPRPPPVNLAPAGHTAGNNLAVAPAPAPAPAPARVAAAPVEEVGNDEDEFELESDDEVAPEFGKRRREARKFTFWNFVEKIDVSSGYCVLGCLDPDCATRKVYATPNTGAISRHVEKVHPDIFQLYQKCKNKEGNINDLAEKISKLNETAIGKLAKRRRLSDSFFAKSIKLEKDVASDLRLLFWAISNSISRNSLNDPLFDAWMKSLGVEQARNRHTMQNQHLVVVDELVRENMVDSLKQIPCVSISSDGWRDRARRDWVNLVVEFIREKEQSPKLPKLWEIVTIEPDLILLPSSATADTLAYLINDALDSIVLSS